MCLVEDGLFDKFKVMRVLLVGSVAQDYVTPETWLGGNLGVCATEVRW